MLEKRSNMVVCRQTCEHRYVLLDKSHGLRAQAARGNLSI